MGDERRQAGLSSTLLATGRLNRRALLRTAGAVAVAGPFGVTARQPGAAAQEAGGAIVRSRPRAAVMREILDAYPALRRDGAPEGGSVTVAHLGDLDSFNPLFALGATTVELLSLVYEGLVGVHPVDGSIIPWLADYERAADGVTYTFRIHPDARFHDGALVTAADAEFTLDTFLDPDSPVYSSSVKDVLKEYRAVDDRTFVLVSNEPIASFLYDVPLLVMPKHVWAGVVPADWPGDPGSTGQDPARVVGSGPFTFVEWVQGDHVTLARNDDYWNRELSRAPYLDNLIFQIMTDSYARVRALEAGDIDVTRLPPTEIDRLKKAGAVAVVSHDDLGFVYYAYQLDRTKTPLFQDKAVRQALFVALDRQAIVDTIMAGQGEVARGTHPPLSPAYRPREFADYAYDPARARQLLAQAGWADADGDDIVEKEGRRFSFTMPYRGDVNTGLAAYMQQAWADIGVEMKPESLPPSTLFERVVAGEFEMVLVGIGLAVDPGQGWMFGTEVNFFGYSNPEYDRLEAEQRSNLDPEERIDLIVEQTKIVWDELPVGVLAFTTMAVGHNERLRNIFPNAFGLTWSAPFWYLEG